MDLKTKRQEALKLLASTGMKSGTYAPPLLSLLWRFGLDVPPPHFSTFAANFTLMGSWFAICLVLLGWLLQLDSPSAIFVKAGIAGSIFGLTMAAFFAYGKHKHRIPYWKEFGKDQM